MSAEAGPVVPGLTAGDDLASRLRADLAVDRVLSFAQVRRRYGERLNARRVRSLGLSHFELVVETVSTSPNSMRVVDMVARTPLVRTMQEWRVAHLAGVAEMRSALLQPHSVAWDPPQLRDSWPTLGPDVRARVAASYGAVAAERAGELRRLRELAPEVWISEADAVAESEKPDAWWYRALGPLERAEAWSVRGEDGRAALSRVPAGDLLATAIEYDAGSYRPPVIARKVRAFERDCPGGVFWGVSSPRRVARVTRLVPRSFTVFALEWW